MNIDISNVAYSDMSQPQINHLDRPLFCNSNESYSQQFFRLDPTPGENRTSSTFELKLERNISITAPLQTHRSIACDPISLSNITTMSKDIVNPIQWHNSGITLNALSAMTN